MNIYFLLLAYLSLFALGLSDNIRGPLYPEILEDLKLNNALGSLFFAAASLCGLIGSYLSRFSLRSFNPLVLLRLCLLSMGLSMFVSGFSQNFFSLIFCQVIFGGSLGAMGVVQNLLAKEGSPVEKRSQILAGLHSMYGLASLLAPLLVSLVYYCGGSWRSTFMVGSSLPLAILIGTFFGFSTYREHPQLQNKRDGKSLIAHRQQIFAAIALGFYVVSEIVIGSRLVLYLRKDFEFSLAAANERLTLYFVFIFAGRLFFTWKKLPFSLSGQVKFLMLTTGLFFLLGLWVEPLFLSLCGLTMAGVYPLTVSYFSHLFSKSMESLLSYCFTFSSGFVVVMHFSIGYLTETYGIHSALHLGVLSLFLAILLFWFFEFRMRTFREA
ncbi:MAG: sugar MFS transporter [Pseudobdellovibrionaceae bacterium]